ncbi:MAG: Y-family DNA polymerase [Thermoguttaceae bacterium]|nr:Y-family DNA polymerase [Thermoguttaceae bacterium]
MFGLVDCNSFFASCEKVFVPRLWDQPVVVLSNNDGCVIARSPEAKALGIAMGAPFFQIRRQCEAMGVSVFSANFELYSDMSRRVMQTLRQWCPDIQVYSIDEAFLNLRGVENAETEDFQRNVIETVRKWTGIPVSFGVGPTKTLAKIATHIAKTRRTGHFTLTDPGTIQELLPTIPIEEVWGIGRRTAKIFISRGIRTAWDLYRQDPIAIRHEFSICQERTVRELRGEPCLELEDFAPPKYSIQYSRSFGTLVTDLETLCQPTASFLGNAMARLRKYCLFTSAVWLSLYGFSQPEGNSRVRVPYSEGLTIPLDGATNDTLSVQPRVLAGLRKLYRSEIFYQKAGVTLLALSSSAGEGKYRMFQTPEERNEEEEMTERRKNLMETLDFLRQKLGKNSIGFAVEGLPDEQEWKARSERRSPAYTTNWDELPKAE